MADTEQPELQTTWTVKQVAHAFQVTDETVRNWINEGLLKALKLGNEWRILNDDLVVFTKERYSTR